RLTGVPPGGWASSDAAGALPNVSDTARALLALSHWPRPEQPLRRERMERAVQLGITWFLELQQEDGGWPTFYHGNRASVREQSATDVSADVLRALAAWQRAAKPESNAPQRSERIGAAIERGWRYLESQQQEDGSLIPRWFG